MFEDPDFQNCARRWGNTFAAESRRASSNPGTTIEKYTLLKYPDDKNCEGAEAFEWCPGIEEEHAPDEESDCETDPDDDGPFGKEENHWAAMGL